MSLAIIWFLFRISNMTSMTGLIPLSMQPQGSKVGVNIVPFNIHIMKPMQEDN